VLVVGFGAGVTAGSFVPYSGVSRINICELEPLIPRASGEYFSKENNNVLHDTRTHIVYDDARHYILTSPDKFDVITTDPIHPWVKGSSTLFSKEYFELVRSHLNAGGIAAQWLPLYESDDQTIRTELATFFSVFPNATVWSNFIDGDGYDLVLLGSADPQRIFLNDLQNLLDGPGYASVRQSLDEIGVHSVADLAATYAGRAQDMASYTAGVPVNMDLNMRLQYIAGLGVNSIAAPRIYRDVLSFRSFPEDLFAGRGEIVDELRELIGRPRRIF
jgi:spermidine synthase